MLSQPSMATQTTWHGCMGACSMPQLAWRAVPRSRQVLVAPCQAAPSSKNPAGSSGTPSKGGKGSAKPSPTPSSQGSKQSSSKGKSQPKGSKTSSSKGSGRPGSSSGGGSNGGKAGASSTSAGTSASAAFSPGQVWRVFQVIVPYASDPGKDDISGHEPLRAAVVKRLGCKNSLSPEAITLVRKSFDSRAVINGIRVEKRWVYIVDVDAAALQAAGGAKLPVAPGQLELQALDDTPPVHVGRTPTLAHAASTGAGSSTAAHDAAGPSAPTDKLITNTPIKNVHPVVIVGSGPAGLFAALTAAQAGLPVVVLERGQPVEQRGKDIGALLVRGVLNPDSNLCYGEGGAGTWSDGKLATKIGRNSDPVRAVLQAFVDFGAPEHILVVGKPHLGTDRLVMMLKHMRHHLLEALGAKIRFGTAVEDLEVSHGRVTGVKLEGSGEVIKASAVVLSVGHSARKMYRRLLAHDILLTPKSFAMGFRVEHPQGLIDEARYGVQYAADVQRGKGRIPVADYKLNVEVVDETYTGPPPEPRPQRVDRDRGSAPARNDAVVEAGAGDNGSGSSSSERADKPRIERGGAGVEEYGGGSGRPVPPGQRGVYSFCMCPGGQIVCTSTTPEELCLNGMSFSRRNSQWANSALVVNTNPSDWAHHEAGHGVLSGIAFQEEMEREAARRGGGALVAPVQRVTDFLAGSTSTGTLPSSSYRLGVKSAPLHDLYPPFVSAALAKALQRFERSIPGFMSSPDALLHGIEARTSAPIRIDRDPLTLESVSLGGLYPSGEGAGYAGGIVSAAVDGMKVGQAIVAALVPAAATGAV